MAQNNESVITFHFNCIHCPITEQLKAIFWEVRLMMDDDDSTT